MEPRSKIELFVKVLGPVLTVAGILVGVHQFNTGQKNLQKKEFQQRQFELQKMLIGNQFEAIAKFKELQSEKYKVATETISTLVYDDNYQSPDFKKNLKRFWQLYWVELSAVEDGQVEGAMKRLGDFIQILEERNFKDMSQEEKGDLRSLGYSVAQAIKESSKTWNLPTGFNK